MSSSTSLSVSGYAISDLAHRNTELLDIAKNLRDIAAKVPDPTLQRRIAEQLNRILDVAEGNDRVVRSVIPVR